MFDSATASSARASRWCCSTAIIAANVAARYPSRILSASLIAPPAYDDSTANAAAVAPWIADLEHGAGLVRFAKWLFTGISDSVAAGVNAQVLTTNPPATLAAVLRSMGALMIPAARARTVRVPAVIAVGTGDPLLAQARGLAARWPEARFVEVPGADHASIVARPEVWAAIRTLMRTRRAATLAPSPQRLAFGDAP